jgi:hypothetical protein
MLCSLSNVNQRFGGTFCDEHAVGEQSTVKCLLTTVAMATNQQSTVETLLITVAKQHNNGSDQCFLWGPFTGYIVWSKVSYKSVTWTVPVTSEYTGRAAAFGEELQLQ